MCSNNIISNILGVSDKNLVFTGDGIEKIRGIEFKVLNAVLTYVPKACSKCGCVNENYSVVKNGRQIVKVILNRSGNNPLMLKIKKQRFYCKHCNETFMAETPLTDKGCFISRDVKISILQDLCKYKSMKLIAEEHFVSSSTVSRVLRSTEIKNSKKYLPRVLGIDEFKSLKSVDAAMSVNLVNNETGKVFDILPDRRKHYLRQYFLSYPKEVREKVEFITTDMYETYIELGKELFPNATIILDKFHIVQLLTRNINKLRVDIMKKFKTNSHEYRMLKRYWKLPLAKHWKLNGVYFYKYVGYKKLTNTKEICSELLSFSDELREAYVFYQDFLYYIEKRNVKMISEMLSKDLKDCPLCFRTSLKSLKNKKQYVLNALITKYTNARVEGKNNTIKVLKRVSFGFRSFKNLRLRVLLREKIQVI